MFPSVSTGPLSGGGFPNWYNFEDKWQFRNDTSIQAGRHAVKFGIDYARLPKHGGIYGPGSPGNITFWDDPSIILEQLQRPVSPGAPDARHRPVDLHHQRADR